ncbi:MAG: hypothetical protein V9G12_09885 [Microthrixaceae bacterium]
MIEGAFEKIGGLWNRLVMNRRNWWLPLAFVLTIGLGSMIFVGTRTYQDAPPIPDFVAESGETVVAAAAITRGQLVFLKYGLMNYGSMFGDGAGRGPDFTADALHGMARAMRDHHASRDGIEPAAALALAQAEIRRNRHDPASNRVTVGEAQAYAFRELERRYAAMFRGEGAEAFHPAGYITDAAELRDLAAFFFWGGWVCGAAAPRRGATATPTTGPTTSWPATGPRAGHDVERGGGARPDRVPRRRAVPLRPLQRPGRLAQGGQAGEGATAALARVDAFRPTRAAARHLQVLRRRRRCCSCCRLSPACSPSTTSCASRMLSAWISPRRCPSPSCAPGTCSWP